MTHDPFDIQGNKKAQSDSLDKQKENIKSAGDDIAWLMSQERGRRIIYRLLSESGMFATSFNTNALTMAFNEGQKVQGLRLTKMIESFCYEFYQPMIEEAINDRSSDN